MNEQIYYLSELFKILSDQTRLKILITLSKKECNVSELTKIIGTTQSTISHQLRILRQAKLVKYNKIGKNVYYTLYDEQINSILKNAQQYLSKFQPSNIE